jgi:hypothetical protein
MADDALRDLLSSLLSARNERTEQEDAGPRSSSSSRSMNQELLFSFLRGSIESSQGSSSRSRENEPRNRDFLRGRFEQMRRYGMDEDDFYRNSRRNLRGRPSSSDEESPERGHKRSSFSGKPEFRIREDRQYINIMDLFERPAFGLRRKG